MEIKIDTQRDSKDDIRRVIAFLQNHVGDAVHTSVIQEKPGDIFGSNEPIATMSQYAPDPQPTQPAPSGGMFNMFDNPFEKQTTTTTNSNPSTNDILNDTVNFEQDDDDLEEVQRLREKSETKADDFRIMTYK